MQDVAAARRRLNDQSVSISTSLPTLHGQHFFHLATMRRKNIIHKSNPSTNARRTVRSRNCHRIGRVYVGIVLVVASVVPLQLPYLLSRTHTSAKQQSTIRSTQKTAAISATTTETITIDGGSCVYFAPRNYGGPFLCSHASTSSTFESAAGVGEELLPDILRVVFDNATEHGPNGPDARIYYARDVGETPSDQCKNIGPIPSESNAINILYTEESTQLDSFLHNPEFMASFGMYLGFDPRPYTGYVFYNFGFYHLVKRLDYPVAPPKQRMSASSGGGLVVWTASNCNSFSLRLQYLQQLNEIAPVHSLGNCWRTHTPSAKESGRVFEGFGEGNPTQEWEYMGSTYKFWYAAENFLCDGYVTEKFWMPFAYGAVPILYGTSVHASYAPSHDSFLDVRNFKSPEDLGRFLLRLDQDDELYMQYHAWRKRPREEWNPKFVGLLIRHEYGRSDGKADPYAYIHTNQIDWQCKVGAEVLRMKRMGLRNRLEAVPNCTDPKGETIPMPPKPESHQNASINKKKNI